MRIVEVEVGAEATMNSTGEARPPTPPQQRRQQLREQEGERQRQHETHEATAGVDSNPEQGDGEDSGGSATRPRAPLPGNPTAVGGSAGLERVRDGEEDGGAWVSPRRNGRRGRTSGGSTQPEASHTGIVSSSQQIRQASGTREAEVPADETPASDGSEGTKRTVLDASEDQVPDEETKRGEAQEALDTQERSPDEEEKQEAVLSVSVVGLQAEAKQEGEEEYGDRKRDGGFVGNVVYRGERRGSVETEEDIALLEYLSGAESDYSMDFMSRKGEEDDGGQEMIMAMSPRSADSDIRDREGQAPPDSTGRSSRRYPALQTLQEMPHEKYDSPRPASQAATAPQARESELASPESAFKNTTNAQQQTTSLSSAMSGTSVLEGEGEWVACETETGDPYYYNSRTLESQWAPPAAFGHTFHVNELCVLVATENMTETEMKQLEVMLQSGMDLQATNVEGFTPLHVAGQAGNERAVSLLLYHGAKVDTPALQDASTALILACQNGNMSVVQLLLEANASLNAITSDGNTVIHVTAKEGHDSVLVALLDICESSLLNEKNTEGDTPLHIAAKLGYAGCVRELLSYGADTEVEDFQGRTPLVLSILENRVECVQLLQSAESLNTAGNSTVPQSHTVSSMANTRPRDETEQDALSSLHSFLFQILPSGTSPESETVYQLIGEVGRQMNAMNASLQASKSREDQQRIQMEELSATLTTTNEELKKEQALHAHDQRRLAELELEQTTSRASRRALTSRCEMLESIARNAQEKLGRERSEHSRYESILQKKLERSLRENAHVIEAFEGLQTNWASHQEQQREHQQQEMRRESNDYYRGVQGRDVYENQQPSTGEGYYAHERELDDNYGSSSPLGQVPVSTEQEQQYYDRGTEGYSQRDHTTGNLDMPPPLLDEDPEPAEQPTYHSPTRAYAFSSEPEHTATASISPSRVDAVWNQFFENMGRAGEAQQAGYSSVSNPARRTQHTNASSPAVSYHPSSSIFRAVRKNELQQLQAVLLEGVSPNQRDIAEKGTPLHLACELGDVEAVMLLSEFAADLEARDEAGNTPLLVASYQGNYACVKFLLQSAVNLSAVNENGDSALHLAAWDGSLGCVSILLEYGIEPSMTNHFGLTALANMKTRSPLRHKFDDFPEDHPMRQTISILEELEKRDHQETDEQTGDTHDTITDRSAETRASDTDSNTSKRSSWTQWIFGFRGSQADDADVAAPSDEGPQDSDSNDGKSEEVDSEDPEDLASYEESRLDPTLSGQPYERLTPPPEVEEALRRAKAGDWGQERPPPAPTHPMGRQRQLERAILSPTQGLAAGAKKPHPSSPASNVRARYVDTFNSSPV